MTIGLLIFLANMVKSWRAGPGWDPTPGGPIRSCGTRARLLLRELRPGALRVQPPAPPGPAPSPSGRAPVSPTPGPWLRLLSLGAVGAVALVVATGEHALPHDAAALVALALLGGVALAARFGHPDRPELVLASTLALGVFIVQIGLGGVLALTDSAWARGLHVGLGAVSLAIAAIAAAACFRGGATVPRGSLARLRDPHQASHHEPAASDCSRRDAGGRQRRSVRPASWPRHSVAWRSPAAARRP